MKGQIGKRAIYEYVRDRRDQAQLAMDRAPGGSFELARMMGRRDAFDSLLGALEEDVITGRSAPRQSKPAEEKK